MASPVINQLPSPVSDKAGWPWTEGGAQLPDTMEDGTPWPKISIVTPSYNQGRFIEETIRSVLLQGYPNLEYIVMDGGSTDESVEIIKRYDEWIDHWVSEPDEGASDAISKGFEKASGTWINWINSDDFLLPNALATIAKVARLVPDAQWISGGRLQTTEDGTPVEADVPWRSDPTVLGLQYSRFPQDATFARRAFLEENDIEVDPALDYVYDTLMHLQMMEVCKPVLTTAILSVFRQHGDQKTSMNREKNEESRRVTRPFSEKRPKWMRVYHRLMRTRFNSFFKALLGAGVREGLVPSARNWKAVVFDNDEYEWSVIDARHAIYA